MVHKIRVIQLLSNVKILNVNDVYQGYNNIIRNSTNFRETQFR